MDEVCRRRAGRIRVLLMLAGVALAGRLVQLQVVESSHYAAMAEEQSWQRVTIAGERGKIYDRSGRVVALNRPAVRVEVDLAMVEDKDEVARQLADILPMSYKEIAQRINRIGIGRVRVVAYEVPATEAVMSGLSKVRGVRAVETFEREYCFGALAGQVIGMANVDGLGVEGVEKDYDEVLKGRPGEALEETTNLVDLPVMDGERKMRERFPIVAGERRVVSQARHGNSVYLTLDMDIQGIVEAVAREAQTRLKSKSVTVVVMSPSNGDILAMASLPSFDDGGETRETKGFPQRRINGGVWWKYEPGSTFKPFVVAAALEEGKVSTEDTFLCTGHRIYAGKRIKCWTESQGRPPHGRLTLKEVLAQSCNVGMMEVVERLGQAKFAEYFHRFGFDEDLLDNCNSERPGQMPEPPVPKGDFLRFGFGQGYMITPLALATGYCVIANGGEMVKPRLVLKTVDHDTLQASVSAPQVAGRVVSEATAGQVLDAMVLTVEKGTGKSAKIDGVQVAGKTGTAEKAERGKGFACGKKVVSFAAIVPADAPKYVVLVVVDEPGVAASGGTAAGPAAKQIIEGILALEKARRQGQELAASGKVPGETG